MTLIFASAAYPAMEGQGNREQTETVAATPTRAQTKEGHYISWREHIIDDPAIGGVEIEGADGADDGRPGS